MWKSNEEFVQYDHPQQFQEMKIELKKNEWTILDWLDVVVQTDDWNVESSEPLDYEGNEYTNSDLSSNDDEDTNDDENVSSDSNESSNSDESTNEESNNEDE